MYAAFTDVPPPLPPLSDARVQEKQSPPPVASTKPTPISRARMLEILTIAGGEVDADGEVFAHVYQPWYQVTARHASHFHIARHTSTGHGIVFEGRVA